MVIGTHTHVPSADCRILPAGTAFQTDAGMCGDYDSVIGMKKSASISRFIRKMRTEPMTPADGEGTLSGVYVETDDGTGLATHAAPLVCGGRLMPRWPV